MPAALRCAPFVSKRTNGARFASPRISSCISYLRGTSHGATRRAMDHAARRHHRPHVARSEGLGLQKRVQPSCGPGGWMRRRRSSRQRRRMRASRSLRQRTRKQHRRARAGYPGVATLRVFGGQAGMVCGHGKAESATRCLRCNMLYCCLRCNMLYCCLRRNMLYCVRRVAPCVVGQPDGVVAMEVRSGNRRDEARHSTSRAAVRDQHHHPAPMALSCLLALTRNQAAFVAGRARQRLALSAHGARC